MGEALAAGSRRVSTAGCVGPSGARGSVAARPVVVRAYELFLEVNDGNTSVVRVARFTVLD
jgi:hypothetical protein